MGVVTVHAETRRIRHDADHVSIPRADGHTGGEVGRADVDRPSHLTASEGDMASELITIGFEHPLGSCFYEEEVFWRIMRAAGLDPSE
jgi:hypothetical protein